MSSVEQVILFFNVFLIDNPFLTIFFFDLQALNLADPEVPPEDQNRQSTVDFFAALDYAVPALLVLILGPIMCLRSVSIFLRFNIVGTLSVFFLLGFAFFKVSVEYS